MLKAASLSQVFWNAQRRADKPGRHALDDYLPTFRPLAKPRLSRPQTISALPFGPDWKPRKTSAEGRGTSWTQTSAAYPRGRRPYWRRGPPWRHLNQGHSESRCRSGGHPARWLRGSWNSCSASLCRCRSMATSILIAAAGALGSRSASSCCGQPSISHTGRLNSPSAFAPPISAIGDRQCELHPIEHYGMRPANVVLVMLAA
jgi:hypothetical protein